MRTGKESNMPKARQLIDGTSFGDILKAIVRTFNTKIATVLLVALLTLSIVANVIFAVREMRQQRKLKVLRESVALGVLVKDDTTARRRIPCRSEAMQAVLLVVGQSNASNTLDEVDPPPNGVGNFNVNDGNCYAAEEPLAGQASEVICFSSFDPAPPAS
jgi:hypothetical protein